MNRDIVEGNWKQFKGTVRASWCTLIGDDRGALTGRRIQSSGKRQSAYGIIRSKKLRDTVITYSAHNILLPNPAMVGNLPMRTSAPALLAHDNH